MTLVSEIIRRAYRAPNLIPLAATPSAAQSTEALDILNTIILSSVGNEAGSGLMDLNYGGSYDQSSWLTPWIPQNVRLVFNLTASVTLFADPRPQEGQRMSFVDILGNLATYPVTIDGNGRNIEGLYVALLDTDGDYRQWMYRADVGQWVKISELITSDDMPFPVDFDDYFITALALRLSPHYGQTMSQETMGAYSRAKSQFRARYGTKPQIESDLSGYNWYANNNARDGYTNNTNFSIGRPYIWR